MSEPMFFNAYGCLVEAEMIAFCLYNDPNFPAAKDVDLNLVRRYILSLNINLRRKEIKRMAPEVLEEVYSMGDITAEEAAKHQERHPIRDDHPELKYSYCLSNDGWMDEVDRSRDNPVKQLSAWEVASEKEIEQAAKYDTAVVKATAKKTKKAIKKTEKLAQALREAKPPYGPQEGNDEGSGNDSDSTQTSWSPSWASDSE